MDRAWTPSRPWRARWADAHFDLGQIYLRQRAGDRQQDLRAAIEHFQHALEVHTRESFPFLWALLHARFAEALLQLDAADAPERRRVAVGHLIEATSVDRGATDGLAWANAHWHLAVIRAQQADQDPVDWPLVVQSLEQALSVFAPDRFPGQHAELERQLARARTGARHAAMTPAEILEWCKAMLVRGLRFEMATEAEPDHHLLKALDCYRAVIARLPSGLSDRTIAVAEVNVAVVSARLVHRDPAFRQQSVEAYRSALARPGVFDASTEAKVRESLGEVLSDLDRGAAIEALIEARHAYAALPAADAAARVDGKLGQLYLRAPLQASGDDIEKALASLKSALAVMRLKSTRTPGPVR